MKLTHILEAHQTQSFKDYVASLEADGVKLLGKGLNSFVFEHPTLKDVAVKVFLDDDLGYREYIDFCMEHKDNKYLPRVLDTADAANNRRSQYVTAELHANWNAPRGKNPPYSMVFLEKLKPIHARSFDAFVRRLGTLADKGITNLAELGKVGWEKIAEDGSDKDLQELARFFVQQLDQGHKLDVKKMGNFMMRARGVVFIDPFF